MNKILKIRREKRATISEVIVRGKRDIKQNMNSFYFSFSVESSRLIFNNFITVKLRLTFKSRNRPVCNLLVLPECLLDSEANCDGADAEFFFPLFFSFSASFKNSSPRGKAGKLCLFSD